MNQEIKFLSTKLEGGPKTKKNKSAVYAHQEYICKPDMAEEIDWVTRW